MSKMPQNRIKPPNPGPDKLDIIVDLLRKMNARDRWRTIGGTIKNIIMMIPVFLIIWSFWYFYAHGDEFLSRIVTQAMETSGQGRDAILEHFSEDRFGLVDQLKMLFRVNP
jgi:hypothetical protein